MGWELRNTADGSGDHTVSSMDHKAFKSKGIQTFLFLFVFFFVLLSIYRFSDAASARSDSKKHMLLVVKELPKRVFDVLFSCLARGLIIRHTVCSVYMYIPIVIPAVR